ncbi:MAG: hypothetical protein ACP5EQ_02275 [Candidatus Cloacimonadia bacterium]
MNNEKVKGGKRKNPVKYFPQAEFHRASPSEISAHRGIKHCLIA